MKFRKADWIVKTVPLATCQVLVAEHHYARGGSNTATYRHGLFRADEPETCLGVAWWIPPTKSAALATYPNDWRKVLALSRLVIVPGVPTNGASFLLSRSRKMIDRRKWPCLVTYADEWRGHTGAIYLADNWKPQGKTTPEAVFVLDGRMVARKAGPVTRTRAEMEALGAVLVGRFAKNKFTHTVRPQNLGLL